MKTLIRILITGWLAMAGLASAQQQQATPTIRLGDIGAYGLTEVGDDATAREFAVLIGQDKAKEALAAASAAADKGQAVGQFLLGWAAENGKGREASAADAEKAYREAAKRNYIPAVTNLAVLLLKQNPKSEEAVKLLRSAEEKDQKIAGFFLGVAYLGGATGTADFASAAQFWSKAATAGSVIAYRHLGYLYEGTFGFPGQTDVKKAAENYEKAADLNDAEAAIRLGVLILRSGEALGKKAGDAPKWFEKAASSDNPGAIFLLGQVKEMGIKEKDKEGKETEVYPADPAGARALYKKAADKEHAASIFKLGFMMERGLGGDKNEAESIKLYRKAAELGSGDAYLSLGLLSQKGQGVEKDEKEAFRNFLQSALRGSVPGATQTGMAYRAGAGVTPDPIAAAAWFDRAASQGESNAMVSIAEMMLSGQYPMNAELVGKLAQQAFNQGNPRAGVLLGRMAERGVILQQNPAQALGFYRWAAKRDMEDAKKSVEEMQKTLTKEQLEQADTFTKQLEEQAAQPAAGDAKKDGAKKEEPKK